MLIEAETSKAREAERTAAEMPCGASAGSGGPDRKQELAQLEAKHAQQLEELQLSCFAQAWHAEELRQRLEAMPQEELTRQLQEVEQVLAREKAQLHKGESVRLGVNEVKRALVGVHRQLRELSSPDVREAAIRAGGNGLPADLVSPTLFTECAMTTSAVLVEDCVQDPTDTTVWTELHQTTQLHSVLCGHLAVAWNAYSRAPRGSEAELGFRRNMGKETDDLIQQVAIGHSDTKKDMKDMQEETDRFRANLKCGPKRRTRRSWRG